MRLENDATLVELAQLGEAHHLETAGIGKDRMRPVHEPMQAAELGDTLGARRQHQVIGVGEHDVGAERAHLAGYIALTVAAVPTGMKAGVQIARAVEIVQTRAAPSTA